MAGGWLGVVGVPGIQQLKVVILMSAELMLRKRPLYARVLDMLLFVPKFERFRGFWETTAFCRRDEEENEKAKTIEHSPFSPRTTLKLWRLDT
jgi:hypothetical protein